MFIPYVLLLYESKVPVSIFSVYSCDRFSDSCCCDLSVLGFSSELETTTFPTIVGCSWQKYGYSPLCMNVRVKVLPLRVNTLGADSPELNSLPFIESLNPAPDVTVRNCVSSFIHFTVSPNLILIESGEYALSPMSEASGTIETVQCFGMRCKLFCSCSCSSND